MNFEQMIIFTASCLVSIYMVIKSLNYLVRLQYLYIFDGADLRTICIAPALILICLANVYLTVMAFKGYTSFLRLSIVRLSIDTTVILLLGGRLLSFPIIHLKFSKNLFRWIFIVFMMMIYVLFFLVLLYNPNDTITLFQQGGLCDLTEFLYLVFHPYVNISIIIYICLFRLGMVLTIFFVDLGAERSRRTRLWDLSLLAYALLYTTITFILPPRYFYSLLTDCPDQIFAIILLCYVILFFTVFKNIQKEVKSIFRHAEGVNTNIAACQKLLKTLAEDPDNSKAKYYINYIAEVCEQDSLLKLKLFEKHFFVSKKMQYVHNKIEEAILEREKISGVKHHEPSAAS